jgi:hypothetical protein
MFENMITSFLDGRLNFAGKRKSLIDINFISRVHEYKF